MKADTLVTVEQINGTCPVFQVGDSFRLLDGYRLSSPKPVCMHALASLMPHYNALRVSTPDRWGLGPRDGPAHVQCLDPHQHTGGGTVVFAVRQVPATDG